MAERYFSEGPNQDEIARRLAESAEEGKKERAEKGEPATPEESVDILARDKESGKKERIEKGEPATPEESVEFLGTAKEEAQAMSEGEQAQKEAVEASEEAERQAEKQIEEVREEIEKISEENRPEAAPEEGFEPLPGIDAETALPPSLPKTREKLPAKLSFGAKLDKGLSSVGLGFIGGVLITVGAAAKIAWNVFDKLFYSTWLKPIKDMISSIKPEGDSKKK